MAGWVWLEYRLGLREGLVDGLVIYQKGIFNSENSLLVFIF